MVPVLRVCVSMCVCVCAYCSNMPSNRTHVDSVPGLLGGDKQRPIPAALLCIITVCCCPLPDSLKSPAGTQLAEKKLNRSMLHWLGDCFVPSVRPPLVVGNQELTTYTKVHPMCSPTNSVPQTRLGSSEGETWFAQKFSHQSR